MSKSRPRTYGNSKRKAGQFLSRKDDAIHWFQREGFDPAEFIGLLKSEKELDQARNELTQLNEYCKQEVQTVVHAHHKDFLEASRDIQDVEVLVDELRNYVSGSVAVVANLVDLPALPKQIVSSPPVVVEGPHGAVQPPTTWESILALQAELMQELQVAVAERDVSLARALLSAGKHVIAVVDRDGTQLAAQTNGDGLPAWRYAFESSLAALKATLIGELQRQLSQTNSSTLERRQAAQNLGLIVGPGQATQALLGCHSLRVRAAQQHLLKQHSAAGGDPDGVEYAGGLAQRTFLAIGAAAEDVRAVFPSPMAGGPGCLESDRPIMGVAASPSADSGGQAAAVLPPVSALVVQWACDESRHCASLLCRHALTPFVATGMAVGALLCVGLALVFCVALESSHGLALRVAFMEELWPLVEVIVRRHIHRLREEASVSVSVDATNAALQAVAASAAGGSSNPPLLPGPTGLQVFSAGMAPYPGEALPDLLRSSDLPSVPAVPAGLTCLPMLLPELKAMAEGLASLASRPAVAVLRLGVQAIFESVCEKVVLSLTRLMGSAAGSGGGKESASFGSLLASYITRAEKRLRLFAESDVQEALEPLSYVCGPVAPPELLVHFLEPLSELLLKLPEPAPDTALPAGSDPPQPDVLQPQRSGLLDQIRAELEAGEGQRRRERDGWRPKDALGQEASEAVAAAEPAAGVTPATAVTALSAALHPPGSPSTSNGLWAHSVRASAPAAREANPQSVDQGSVQVVEGGQSKQQAPGPIRLAKRLEPPDGDAGVNPGRQLGEAPVRRRREVPLAEPEPEPAPTDAQLQRRHVSGILRAPGIPFGAARQPEEAWAGDYSAGSSSQAPRHRRAVAPPPGHPESDQGEDEDVAAGLSLRSRSRETRGHPGGRGLKASPEHSDSSEERAAPVGGQRPRQVQPLRAAVRQELTENPTSAEDEWQEQQPNGQGRRRRKEQREAEVEEELGGSGRADAQTARSRQRPERAVRFQQLPKPDPVAVSAETSGADEEAPAPRVPEAEAQRATAAARRQTARRDAAPGLSLATWQHDEQQQEGVSDERTSVFPARRLRQTDEQRRHAPQPEVQASGSFRRDAAGGMARQELGRAARRDRGTGDDEGTGGSDAPDKRMSPGPRRNSRPGPDANMAPDEDLLQARRRPKPRLEQAPSEDDDDGDGRASTAANASTHKVLGLSATAAPAAKPGAGINPAVGGLERKGNRFGVVLSDDEGEPVPAPRLRGPRSAAAAASAAAGSRGPELPRPQTAVGSSSLVSMAGAAAAVQADEGRWGRQERPGLPEERARATAEAKQKLASGRNVRATSADDGPIPDEQQQERSTSGRDSAPAFSEQAKVDPRPPSGGRPSSAPAVRDAEANQATGGGAVGSSGNDLPVKPQTARERLAARMAAKVAAGEGLL